MDVAFKALTSLVLSLMAALGIEPPPATWQLQVRLDGRTVALMTRDHPNSTHGTTLAIDTFAGLRPQLGTAGPVRFSLKRDAGTFEFDGVLRKGAGGGTMEFVPSPTFPGELARRGFAIPTRADLYKMAWHDTGFAFIGDLAAQQYARPTLQRLIDAGDHGIDRAYLRDLAALGYRVGTVDTLIRLHDHGVGGEYIRALAERGLARLSPDDLVRAHDHGIGPAYISDLKRLGYTLSLDDLVRAHDHGIVPEWVSEVTSRNGARLPLETLVNLHDHGVQTLEDLRRRTHAS
jgi:hypothetical protein